jgi:hypothetical protein
MDDKKKTALLVVVVVLAVGAAAFMGMRSLGAEEKPVVVGTLEGVSKDGEVGGSTDPSGDMSNAPVVNAEEMGRK